MALQLVLILCNTNAKPGGDYFMMKNFYEKKITHLVLPSNARFQNEWLFLPHNKFIFHSKFCFNVQEILLFKCPFRIALGLWW